jgi:hypothetical protein
VSSLESSTHPLGNAAEVEHVADGTGGGLLRDATDPDQCGGATISPDRGIAELVKRRKVLPALNKPKGRRYSARRDTSVKYVVE